jgi:hypothetical protein
LRTTRQSLHDAQASKPHGWRIRITALTGTDHLLNARIGTAALYAFACLTYACLLSNGHLHGQYALVSQSHGGLDLVFNSMARNLLHGRFDVDPAIVRYEGFLVDGKVVAYWGLAPALLRLPLALVPGGLDADMTALSCLIAACVAAGAQLQALRLIFRQTSPEPSGPVYWLLVLTILFSGPQIEFLKSSVYQEVCLWAGAFGALFVSRALAGVLINNFSTSVLCSLAAIAGLALLSRVSMGMGLYACCGFLLLATALSPGHAQGGRWAQILERRILLPLTILIVFAAAAGFVNFQRWGNPLVFADYHRYLGNLDEPARMARMMQEGLFNLVRVPLSFLYYVLPLWVLPGAFWTPALQSMQLRLFDITELPPSSFLLTDALLVGFSVLAIRTLCAPGYRLPLERLPIAALAAGLCVPCVLMLSAISLTYRYRIEFYPLLEFTAFIGIFVFLRRRPQPPSGHANYLIGAGAATSIGMSACALLLYRMSPFGSGIPLMKAGFWAFYAEQWQLHVAKLIHSFY